MGVLESMPELKATRRHKCSTRRMRFEHLSHCTLIRSSYHPLHRSPPAESGTPGTALVSQARVPRPALPACGEVKWRRGVGGEGTSGHTHARYRPVNTNRKQKMTHPPLSMFRSNTTSCLEQARVELLWERGEMWGGGRRSAHIHLLSPPSRSPPRAPPLSHTGCRHTLWPPLPSYTTRALKSKGR